MKKLVVGLLVFAGAWCAQAASEKGTKIAEVYTNGSSTPTYIVADGNNDDGSILSDSIGMTSANERIVLLKNVTLGVQSIPMWGDTKYYPAVTFDLNGHTIDASGEYCKWESNWRGITVLCNLTFVDSAGSGRISGYQITCPQGCSVTFDLPNGSVISADTGYVGDYDPHGKGTKGSITINGGKYDGCVHGSGDAGTTLLTGGFFNKSKNENITSYDHDTTKHFDNGDGYWRVVPIDWEPVGVRVNGVDLADAPGVGWAYVDGVLSLTNAMAYTLSGSNTTGAVRVEVTSSANVTVSNLTLAAGSTAANLIRFSGASATLNLVGANVVRAANNFSAIEVATNATLTVNGAGELVGSTGDLACGRGVYVSGTLNWNGGTIRDLHALDGGAVYVVSNGVFTLNGGTITNCAATSDGGAVYNNGLFTMNGGTICCNAATNCGSAVRTHSGSTFNMMGGQIVNNRGGLAGAVAAYQAKLTVYGGVMKGNSSVSGGTQATWRNIKSDSSPNTYVKGGVYDAIMSDSTVRVDGSLVFVDSSTSVGENHVIGKDIAFNDDKQLTGGTYTFNPTNAEYVAAGLEVAEGIGAQRQDTDPVKYILYQKTSTLTQLEVAHASYKVYTNEVEVVSPYVVNWGASVKVVYTAETNYVFAGGATTEVVEFEATADPMEVTGRPNEPIHLSGVTVNGLDVAALSGDGWRVIKAISGGYYTVQLEGDNHEYVLHGTNTGGYVRFDVKTTGASLVVSNLTIGGYADNACAGIYVAPYTSAAITLKGINVIWGGAERPAIEVSECASITIAGDGSLAAFPDNDAEGEYADPVGRYGKLSAGTISYSGGRFNYNVPENQFAVGYTQQSISESEGGYDFVSRVIPKLGVKVNGQEIGAGAGDGWTYANGVLSLANATNYTLSGANTAGNVRVEVATNANVTLDNFELVCTTVPQDLFRFMGTDATLTLVGTNTVYAGRYTAIQIDSGARLTLDGTGELVGGKGDSINGRCVCVYSNGTFVCKGGTIRDYSCVENMDTRGAGVWVFGHGAFTMYGGRIVGNESRLGAALYSSGGSIAIYGGDLAGNTAEYGAAIYNHTWTINVYGGNITNNVVTNGAIIHVAGGEVGIYGGLLSGNSGSLFYGENTYLTPSRRWKLYGAAGTDLAGITSEGGDAAVAVTNDLYVVGQNVAVTDGQLTGGTYTFCPTNALYGAAGLMVGGNSTVSALDTTPAKWKITEKAKVGVIVNGKDLYWGAGDGWVFADGVLSLTNATDYTLAGTNTEGAVRVEVTTNATVTLDRLCLTAVGEKISPIKIVGQDVSVTLLLKGTSTLRGDTSATDGGAAIVPYNTTSVTIRPADGYTDETAELNVYGGSHSPGIGRFSGFQGVGGLIEIQGGTVNAWGGSGSSAIGLGYKAVVEGDPLRIRVSGGRVTATADDVAAIGSSSVCDYEYSGYAMHQNVRVEISGGTVSSTAIGNLGTCAYDASTLLTGGSVSVQTVQPAPSNGMDRVWCVTVPGGWADGMPVEMKDLSSYGTNGIVSIDGKIFLWLPNGNYAFTANGKMWGANVEGSNTTAFCQSTVTPQEVENATYKVYTNDVEVTNRPCVVACYAEVMVVYTANAGYVFTNNTTTAAATFVANAKEVEVPADKLPAAPIKLTGVLVDGTDAAWGSGEGWSYTNGVLSLANATNYTLSGTNTAGEVRVSVTTNVTAMFDNLLLKGLTNAAVTVQSGAKLTLPGDGTFVGGKVLEVASGGAANVYGGVFDSEGEAPFQCETNASLVVRGGVYDVAPEGVVSNSAAVKIGENYVVGSNVTTNENAQLTGGTYTFCPTNANYVAADLEIATNRTIVVHAGDPTTYEILPILSQVMPQEVANTTYKVYTNGVEVTSPHWVAYRAEVMVIYTVNDGYVFTNDTKTATAIFVADAEKVEVPADQLPAAPLKLTGVLVDGTDAAWGSGEGWIFADGVLSLTNATNYTLSGTNTEGAVRVEVTESANVTISNLTLICRTTQEHGITFKSSATNATLTLVGTNTAYSVAMEYPGNAVCVSRHAKVTLMGDGVLIGSGKDGDGYFHGGYGIYVDDGTFVMKSATITKCSLSGVGLFPGTFTMDGGTISECLNGGILGFGMNAELNAGTISGCGAPGRGAAICLTVGGTVNIRDGMVISSNTNTASSTVFVDNGRINIWGGTFTGNSANKAILVRQENGVMNVYGGVFTNNTGTLANGCAVYGLVSDLSPEGIVSNSAAVKIGDNYVVGANVTTNEIAELTGGTYTFNPTNALYEAAGFEVADDRMIVERTGDPTTYQVLPIVSTITVPHPLPTGVEKVDVTTNGTTVVGTEGKYEVKGGSDVTVTFTAADGYGFGTDNAATCVTNFPAIDGDRTIAASDLPIVVSPTVAKAVVAEGTVTFLFDNLRHGTEDVRTLPAVWTDQDAATVTNAVIDSSFASDQLQSAKGLFRGLAALVSVEGIENLDLSAATSLRGLFENCRALSALDLRTLVVTNVTDFGRAFAGCSNLTTITVAESFVVPPSANSEGLFADCVNIRGGLGTVYDPTATDGTRARIDLGADAPGYLTPADKDRTIILPATLPASVQRLELYTNGVLVTPYVLTNATTYGTAAYYHAFATNGYAYGESTWTNVVLGTVGTNIVVDAATVPLPTAIPLTAKAVLDPDGNLVFYYDYVDHSAEGTVFEVPLAATGAAAVPWLTAKANIKTVSFDSSFAGYKGITSTHSWFEGCEKVTSYSGFKNLDSSQVKDMTAMFKDNTSLTDLDLTDLNTTATSDTASMFEGDELLENIKFDTVNDIFGGMTDKSDISSMFERCGSLKSLDLRKWVSLTTKVAKAGLKAYKLYKKAKNLKKIIMAVGAIAAVDILCVLCTEIFEECGTSHVDPPDDPKKDEPVTVYFQGAVKVTDPTGETLKQVITDYPGVVHNLRYTPYDTTMSVPVYRRDGVVERRNFAFTMPAKDTVYTVTATEGGGDNLATQENIYNAIYDAITVLVSDPDYANLKKKIDNIAGTDKAHSRDEAAWIHKHGIKSANMKTSNYSKASFDLDMPLLDNGKVRVADFIHKDDNSLAFKVEVAKDEASAYETANKNIVDMVKASLQVGAGASWRPAKSVPTEVEVDYDETTGRVTLVPQNGYPQEFFRVILPTD